MSQQQPANTTDPLIRSACDFDFPAIARLITDPDELFRVFPAGSWPLNAGQIHRLAEQRRGLTVGSIDNKIVAFANLYDVQPGKWAFIGNVVVHETQRGKGIGRALLDHMLDLIFIKHALPEARISVFSDNSPALQLYKTLGFTEYHRESRKHPHGCQVTLLHLKLQQAP